MDWQEDYRTLDGVRLHYTRGGHGSPILLLHGLTDNGRCWGRTAEALAEDHDLILLDQRAHGLSDAPEQGYQPADFAADAAGLIRHLYVSPIAVMGHSLGAVVGLTLATTAPDLVSRLVLNDPPLQAPSPDEPSQPPADSARLSPPGWLAPLRQMALEALTALCHSDSPDWSAGECAHWAESKLQVNPRLWLSGDFSIRCDWRAAMARLACPTLLIRGEPSYGSIVGDSELAEASMLLRHGSIVQIDAAGHSVHRDQADRYLAAVRPFLSDRP